MSRILPRDHPIVVLSAMAAATLGVLIAVLPDPRFVVFGFAALGGGLLICYRVELGLLALVLAVFTNLSDVLINYHGLPPVTKALVPFLLLLVAVRWVFLGERPSRESRVLFVLLLVYGLVSALSLGSASDVARGFEELGDYVKDALIALIVTFLLTTASCLRVVIWTILSGALFLGSIVAFQFLTQSYESSFWGFGQTNILNIVGETNDYRASGPMSDPNFFAQIMLIPVPLAFERMLNERSPVPRIVAAFALLATLCAIAFTFSRGGLVGLAIVAAFMLWSHRPPLPVLLAGIGIALLAAVYFMPVGYSDRISILFETLLARLSGGGSGATDSAIQGRIAEMWAAWIMFLDHPLTGVGVGQYELYFQSYSLNLDLVARGKDRASHSLYLDIAAERGILGLTTFGVVLAMSYVMLKRAWTTLTRAGEADHAAMVFALGVSLLGYLVAATFLHGTYDRYLWMLVGMIWALPDVARRLLDEASSAPEQYSPDLPKTGSPH